MGQFHLSLELYLIGLNKFSQRQNKKQEKNDVSALKLSGQICAVKMIQTFILEELHKKKNDNKRAAPQVKTQQEQGLPFRGKTCSSLNREDQWCERR